MNAHSFFTELKRRRVYSVAAAYIVTAWLLIQVATQVFPFFDIPNWVVRLVVVLAIIGFPIAVVCSWAFEITPEGIKLEGDVDHKITRKTGRKLTALIVIVAALAAGVTVFRFLHLQQGLEAAQKPPRAVAIESKSIAVLPFENLSAEKANAYFADGIQDEILTRLSQIADLKVISRTSTQHYQSAPENLPEIGRELGVAHILEGNVQKSGDTVRINVRLIVAADDSFLWAESFDRKLTDIFSVESEVAKAIADQLQARLTGREEQIIAARSTENPDAYDAYLRGLAYNLKTANSAANSRGAQKYLREAVRLDPKFALAWTLLSFVDARGYLTQTLQPTIALREEARQAATTALTLQPNLGEALHAQGYYYYACLKDYATAVSYFERARPLLPNSSRIPESLAYVKRRQGQWDESDSYFKKAERLDPRNVCSTRFSRSRLTTWTRWRSRQRSLRLRATLPRAAALLAPLHPPPDDSNVLYTQVYQAILERRPAPVIPRLQELLATPDSAWGYFTGELRFWLGWTQDVAGDHAAVQESWRTTRRELEPFLKEQPENYNLLYDLALTEMGLGNKTAALSFSERARAAMPIEKDAFDGPAPIEILARVAAQVGEPDRAITALQELLSVPYEGPLGGGQVPLTPALLRLDPMFDSLRNDPRFQKLALSSNPK